MSEIVAGSKVEYNHKGKWRKGVVHGIRQQETSKGRVTSTSYLVDTGKDERLDETHYDPRQVEANNRVGALIEKGLSPEDAVARVEKQKDLPESSEQVETFRQPEQVEVDADNIRLAE